MAAPMIEESYQADSTLVHADSIRRQVVEMCFGPEGGHLGGSLSIVDILAVLYFEVLANVADGPGHPERDLLLLSKGHGAIALYAALAERGYLPTEELQSFGRSGGRLMGHPVRALPGIELPTGSLGHGLGLGAGFAMAAQLRSSARRTFVIVGDGELQEGSCWESAAVAASQRLDRLVAIVDRNGLQLTGPTEQVVSMEPLADRWRSFGWEVREVDGHDHQALAAALHSAPWTAGRPSVLIAHTHKGHGVAKLADQPQSHCLGTLSDRQQRQIRTSLATFLAGGAR
jgi:transketolase